MVDWLVGWIDLWVDLFKDPVTCLSFSRLRAVKICGSQKRHLLFRHFWVSGQSFLSTPLSFCMISFKSEISMITACLLFYHCKFSRNVETCPSLSASVCLLHCLFYFVYLCLMYCLMLGHGMTFPPNCTHESLVCLWQIRPEWHGKENRNDYIHDL